MAPISIPEASAPSVFVQFLAGVGVLYLSSKLYSFVRLLLSAFVLPGISLSKYGPPGSWAVITGASDGIGAEFARQLARKRFNVVLVSRTESKLSKLAQELEQANSSTETRILAMDFSQNQDSDYDALAKLVSDLDVSVLVNNVGVSHSIPVPFTLTPSDELSNIVNVNVFGTLRVTQIVAPAMAQRKRGLILTMASFGGVTPTPLLATYSGSKAFLQYWSSSLGAELAPSGVKVQLVQSYLVTSAMSKIRKASMLIPNPKDFVRSALAKVGRSGGSQGIASTCTPYWSHGFMHWALLTFTGTMNSLVLGQNKAMHESIRKRALKKQERDSKKGS